MTDGVGLVLLTPGSGGSADHLTLIDLEQQLKARLGLEVVRYDFAYRRAGKKSPGRADRLVGELAEVVAQHAADRGIETGSVVIGGRSMGGRVCSMAVAEGLAAAGLLLLSYPLHPPGKPESTRVAHWPQIAVPSLFVSGDNDPFGRPDEFDREFPALAQAPAAVWLEGGAHDPKRKDQRVRIVDETVDWISSTFG